MEQYRCYKVCVIETIPEGISDVVEFSPQNVRMARVLSAGVATLAARDLVEALKNSTPNAPFATINDTHNTALRILAGLFNIVPKSAGQTLTNRHNGRQQEVSIKPEQFSTPITH